MDVLKRDPRLSRRHLNTLIVSMLPHRKVAGASLASPVAARLQDAPTWRPDQGLHLAGSTEALLSLDPALSRDLQTNFLLRQIYRGLLRLDDQLNVRPELAESISVSDDGMRYMIALRESIRFHDGRPIDAFDVEESLSRALRPSTAGGLVDMLAGVTYLRDIVGAQDVMTDKERLLPGVVVHDARNLSILIDQPSATFLMKLASVPASIIDRHQVIGDSNWATKPNGSGPFQCESFLPGDELLMSAASTWWAGAPVVPTVHVRLGPSAGQPINRFQSGEIDIADRIPGDQRDLLRDPASGFDESALIETPLFATSYIALGNSEPPLDDIHIRRAIRLAFPAGRIATARFDGSVTVARGLIPDGMLGKTWTIEGGEPNLDAAMAEISASRYKDPSSVPSFPIHAADIEPVEALRDIIGRDLGITIEAISVNWPDFLDGLASRKFPSYALYWGADYPDPESFLWMLFGSDSPENYTGYRNDEFDSLLSRARQETDPRIRIEHYDAAHRLLIEDAAVLPLYFDVGYTAIRPGIAGLAVTAMGILGLETIRPAN